MAEKRFRLCDIDQERDADTGEPIDPLADLKSQRRIDDILLISNSDATTIGQIAYQATWVYNKSAFFENLLFEMKQERKVMIDEIRAQDKKLQLIAKPFGGYINILDVDDVHFEDPMMPENVKAALAVSTFEEKINQRFNLVGGSLGLRDTKWGRAAIILFGLWASITCIVCFEKADFLNVSFLLIDSYS